MIGGQSSKCENQVCNGPDRCYAMTYTKGGRAAWLKGCMYKDFCDWTDQQICDLYDYYYGGYANCKVTCSEINNVQG